MRRGLNPKTNNRSTKLKEELFETFLLFLKTNKVPYYKEWIRYVLKIPSGIINKNAVINNVPLTAFFSWFYNEYDIDTYHDKKTQEVIKELNDDDISNYLWTFSLSPNYLIKKYSADNFDFEMQKKLCYMELVPKKASWYYVFHITPYVIHYMYTHPDFIKEISDENFIYLDNNKWEKLLQKKQLISQQN